MDDIQQPVPDASHRGTDKIAAALAKAQGLIKAPQKKRTVDYVANGQRVFYNYADLADVIEAVTKPLSDNGIAVSHRMEVGPGGCLLITDLLHSSGQKMSTEYPLKNPTSMKPQAFGSEMTYARRYSLSSLVGIASEEDDDGQAAAGNGSKPAPAGPKPASTSKPKITPQTLEGAPPAADRPKPKITPKTQQVPTITKGDLTRLNARYKESGWTLDQMKNFINLFCRVPAAEQMHPNQFEDVMQALTLTPDGAIATFLMG